MQKKDRPWKLMERKRNIDSCINTIRTTTSIQPFYKRLVTHGNLASLDSTKSELKDSTKKTANSHLNMSNRFYRIPMYTK